MILHFSFRTKLNDQDIALWTMFSALQGPTALALSHQP